MRTTCGTILAAVAYNTRHETDCDGQLRIGINFSAKKRNIDEPIIESL